MSRLCLAAAVALLGACATTEPTSDPCADIDPLPEGESLSVGVQELSRKARCEKRRAAAD